MNIKRLTWIDWMKCIGMYFIILGHFFSIGYRYVYVFSVPLFFFISGFLCKYESNQIVFWRKLWSNLVVPTIIIYVINALIIPLIFSTYHYVDLSSMTSIRRVVLYPIIGMQNALDTCWFIYTLIVIKILHQYVHKLRWRNILIISSLFLSYIYNHIDMSIIHPLLQNPNAIANAFTAYPFFVVGNSLYQYKDWLNNYHNKKMIVTCFFICIIIVYLCGNYNNDIWMYMGGYGDNMVLFLMGGIAGSIAIFCIAKIIPYTPHAVITISIGTIIILGFHKHFISITQYFFHVPPIIDFFSALIILFLFIPIIKILEIWFPVILGKHRINNNNRQISSN